MINVTGSDIYEYVANRMHWTKSDGTRMSEWDRLPTSDRDQWKRAAEGVNTVVAALLPDGPPDPG